MERGPWVKVGRPGAIERFCAFAFSSFPLLTGERGRERNTLWGLGDFMFLKERDDEMQGYRNDES
jgi:hypothetical protein